MIERYYNIINEIDGSIFLFGARQTGKSTALKAQFNNAIYIDLLDGKIRRRFQSQPELLFDLLKDKLENSIIIIDEIPEVPELLNEVHRLISQNNLQFVLCGSSARKLRRKGYNTLGGRAYPCYFYPFVSTEISDLDLDRALTVGLLPKIYLSKNPQRELTSYIDIYLKEEIQQEALVRNLNGFQRFLEVAALTNGEMVNYANIASDCNVAANTVREYFSILQDTLVGYFIPAYQKTVKRKLTQAPRFYFFDMGISNYLLKRTQLAPGTPEYGHSFEQFVATELIAYIGYNHKRTELSYWHTYSGQEVDFVIGDAEIAIEVKSTDEIQRKHLSGLKSFHEEHPECRLIAVSRDIFNRKIDNVEAFYIFDFLNMLWKGDLF